ncbi:hypothetical protein [Bradyrhizobium sp. AZCC 2289]|uniref:hypothetical protein n=1 Tax=Bradyrhizobium sp. AZCC 2289 TaxID=3117026 RepID=UPI002FF26CFC
MLPYLRVALILLIVYCIFIQAPAAEIGAASGLPRTAIYMGAITSNSTRKSE